MNSGFVELHYRGDSASGVKKGQPVYVAIDSVVSFTATNLANGKESGTVLSLNAGSKMKVTEFPSEVQKKIAEALSNSTLTLAIGGGTRK